MQISDIAGHLQSIAPLTLQEDYDNAGLLAGDPQSECTGILCTLDVTEDVIAEAVSKKCNCIVAHHPVIFRGMKKITVGGHVERAVIKAIKNDVAIYAAHTNFDNILTGVNGKIADTLGLTNRKVLEPKRSILQKLFTYVPAEHLENVRNALFAAGAGNISNYSECSFTNTGTGTFKPGEGADPYTGKVGQRQEEPEIRLEVILPFYKKEAILNALFSVHPYEEVAYDLLDLSNEHPATGSGLIGDISEMTEQAFLVFVRNRFNLELIRHSPLINRTIKRVAVCGGAGSFLIPKALASGADAFLTGDVKYHEFFGADGRMLLCDIGHYESEQFTTDLFKEILEQKFPTFAVLKSEIKTNPVNYFTGK